MKKKPNGIFRTRINCRGYEQVDGQHYDGTSIRVLVTNDTSVRITMVIALMAGWHGKIVNVIGAFLNGELGLKKEKMWMYIPEGFEESEAWLGGLENHKRFVFEWFNIAPEFVLEVGIDELSFYTYWT